MNIKTGYAVSVSVIVPVYNSENELRRAVRSVLHQTYSDWEIIIVDDYSTDQSASVAKHLAAFDKRIILLENSMNLGVAASRNRALEMCSGRYIAFLDADDEWLPHKLETQLKFMSHGNHVLCYAAFWRQSKTRKHYVRVPQQTTYRKLLFGNTIPTLTAMYDRDFFGKVPMPNLTRRQDFALWLELLNKSGTGSGIGQPLAIYHVTANSLSSNRIRSINATWSLYRSHLKLSFLQSLVYLASHNLRRLFRG